MNMGCLNIIISLKIFLNYVQVERLLSNPTWMKESESPLDCFNKPSIFLKHALKLKVLDLELSLHMTWMSLYLKSKRKGQMRKWKSSHNNQQQGNQNKTNVKENPCILMAERLRNKHFFTTLLPLFCLSKTIITIIVPYLQVLQIRTWPRVPSGTRDLSEDRHKTVPDFIWLRRAAEHDRSFSIC